MRQRLKSLAQKFRNEAGQNVIEYALLSVAVLVVVIAFVGRGALFPKTLQNIVNDVPSSINRLKNEIVF